MSLLNRYKSREIYAYITFFTIRLSLDGENLENE